MLQMTKTYNVTRESAASILNVSTRTIDRYVKNGKLSYKKIANKVILAKEEIDSLKEDFSALRQEISSEIVGNQSESSSMSTTNSRPVVRTSLEEAIDEKVDKFFLIFKEKDKILDEKNKVIFMLQQRVTELETKIQHMIALPDYNKEKQEALIEKEKLESKINQLKGTVKGEKVKNLIFIALSLIFIFIAIFFITKG